MAKITLQQAIQYAQAAGFQGQSLITILAIAEAESGLQTDVVNSIGATGILQIYLAVHPDVTSAQAKDPAFSFRYAWSLSGGGKNFCPWQSYDPAVCGRDWDGRYKQYIPLVTAAVQGSPASSGGPNAATIAASTAYNAAKTVKNAWSLASNANVATALQAFDSALSVTNPFDFDTSGIQDNILGTSVTDPVQWLGAVGGNIVNDIVALVLRLILIALGIYLLYKVISHFVDFSGAIQGTASTVSKLAPLLAGA